MMEEVNERIVWLGTAPSGRKIGRIVAPGGTARYVTLNTTPLIKYRYSEVYDNKNCICDVLYAITLDHERLTCIVDAGIATAQKTKRDHFQHKER